METINIGQMSGKLKRVARSKLVVYLVWLGLLTVSSCSERGSSNALPMVPSNASNPQAEQIDSLETVCERVAEIKTFPFADEPVEDPAYNAIIKAGEKVIPCLINKVSDTSPMPDPRQAPKVDTVVGDIAFFMLINLTREDLTLLLPQDVRKDFDKEGIYAYFRYTENKKNREKLRSHLCEWYQKKIGAEVRCASASPDWPMSTPIT